MTVGDKWHAEQTNAVDPRLVAAITMPLLDRKLLLCSLLVCVASLRQYAFVCHLLPSFWHCFNARHGTSPCGAGTVR